MKDLSTLLNHPSVARFDRLLLASGQPITLVLGKEKKAMGAPLNNAQLHALLKASLPAELMAGFQWGKELNAQLDGPSGKCAARIVLRPDKIIQVEILPPAQAAPAQAAPESKPQTATVPAPSFGESEAAEDDPATAAEATRLSDAPDTALIYAPGGSNHEALKTVAETLGYPPRVSENTGAILEVLKYHEYPIFIMCLDSNFRQDDVYRFLTEMNMESRRKQFSVMVAPGLTTGDTMLAFSLSVHLTVSLEEINNLAPIIEKAIGQWQRFVAPLHEQLQKAGRL